jgi:hypothetical protein
MNFINILNSVSLKIIKIIKNNKEEEKQKEKTILNKLHDKGISLIFLLYLSIIEISFSNDKLKNKLNINIINFPLDDVLNIKKNIKLLTTKKRNRDFVNEKKCK